MTHFYLAFLLSFQGLGSALAAVPVETLSCQIQGVTPLSGFYYKSSDRPLLLTAGDTELSYLDFGDPRGVWETRRVYVVLAREGDAIGVGLPEERTDYGTGPYVTGSRIAFAGRALKPLSGTVACEPRELPYLFIHSRAANLALKAPPYTVASFDATEVSARTAAEIRTLDQLLGQSCVLGDNARAAAELAASPRFSKKATLAIEGEGLSFRVDKVVGCKQRNDDETYCVDPIIEKDGQKIVVPPCVR